jgi:hypothetical protein
MVASTDIDHGGPQFTQLRSPPPRPVMDSSLLKQPRDASRINLHQTWEIQYWTKTLGISEPELRDAVQRAGHNAEAVRHYLRKHR